MTIDRLGIRIDSFYIIRFYGIALLCGILAAAVLIAYRAKRAGENADHLWNGLVWVVLAGIVGARIYHVLTPPPSMGITTLDYLTDPLKAINIRSGGLGVPGALIGGGLAAYFYTRRSKLSFAKWADLIAPGVALGQAIGRLGNFVNQELYGRPTDLPWAIAISPENRVPGYEQFSRFHPMFLYEMIVNLLICIGLIGIDSRFGRRLRSGDLLAIYAVLYGCGRFFLEFLKLDAPAFGQGLTIAQLLSLITVAAGLLFIWLRHRRWAGHSAEEPSS